MPKQTGALCRDDETSLSSHITFWPGHKAEDMKLFYGYWKPFVDAISPRTTWTRIKFVALYPDIKRPDKGKCFDAELDFELEV